MSNHFVRSMRTDTTEEAEEMRLREIGIIPPFGRPTWTCEWCGNVSYSPEQYIDHRNMKHPDWDAKDEDDEDSRKD